MKKTFIIAVLFMLLTMPRAYAGQYQGIEPGLSNKTEVVSILGKPKEEVVKNKRFIFEASQYDLKVLSVVFYDETNVVQSIELYPQDKQHFSEYKEWFNLNDPFDQSYDVEGNLVETFLPHAVRLHYDGPNNLAPVLYFEHFDIAEYEDYSLFAKKRPYLGVRFLGYSGPGYKVVNVDEASPAHSAGLLDGDIILSIGKESFNQKELDPTSFVPVLSLLPLNEKVSFTVMRLDPKTEILKEVSLDVTLREMTADQMEASAQEALVLFQQGQFLLNNGDTYAAMELFKNALWLNPYEPLFYASLADAYYRVGLTDFALDELNKSIQMSPQHFPFFLRATIYIEQGEYDKGIANLKKALALNAEDTQIREKLGYCYMRKEMYGEAIDVFKDVLVIKENSPVALFFSAVCYERIDNKEDAFILYKKFLATHPSETGMKKDAEEKVAAYRDSGLL